MFLGKFIIVCCLITALKHSPSKRKPGERYGRTTSMTEDGKTPIPGM